MKLKVFCLVCLVVALLSGCKKAAPTPTVEAPKVDVRDTFYFLAANNRDPFYVPGVKGLNDAAASLGMKAEFVGPMDLNMAEHYRVFEQLIVNPDTAGIMLYPTDPSIQGPLILEAQAKGIPVVMAAADSPTPLRDAFVGYDNAILGVQAAEWAASLIGGQGTVGTMGLITAGGVMERAEAFAAHLRANYPGITVVEGGTHDGSAEGEVKALDSYMIANPDLTLLWWADGAAATVAQPVKERQEAGLKTLFLATDMPDATLQAVKDGVFVGSVGQDTYTEAYWSVLVLNQLRLGQRVPDTLYLSAIMVDKSNVDQYLSK